MDSILFTIKKMLGLDPEYDVYDTDIIVLINSALMTLQQYGAVPKEGFVLENASSTWHDALVPDKVLEGVKTYVYLKVKMIFDPPSNSFLMDAFQKMTDELEWRIREQLESYPGDLPREAEEGEG